ncbi:MAG: hypothetical protein WC836_17865 [Desulfobacula sp.]|jgi:hypothetical protein
MKYLARLISEKRPPLVLPKLPEPPFSSYSSTVGRHILKIDSVSDVVDSVKDIPKTEKAPAPDPQKRGGDTPLPLSKNNIVSCFTCYHYDGKGAAWPGMCRYFETIGQAAQEIDFNVVDPVHGCGCFKPPHVELISLVASNDRRYLRGDDPGWIPLDQSRQPLKRETTSKKPSPVALKWIREHRQELRQAGWTGRELYRANKSKGICWCGLWDKPFLKVYLHSDRVIEFECVDSGRDCIQTAQPESFWNKNKKGYDND